MKTFVVDLESLKERYTEWWKGYIPQQLRAVGMNVVVIEGETLSETVEVGTVLDASSTCFYKATQLQKICKLFKEGQVSPYDSFLFTDLWFPGIEMVPYMAQLYKIPIRIYGVWLAGSTTHNDFAEPMHSWARFFEIGFLSVCNGIFVGSEYSAEILLNRLLYPYLPETEAKEIAAKIYPFGLPLNYNYLQQFDSNVRINRIIFPHRPDPEKNPSLWIEAIRNLSLVWDDFEKFEFIFCTSKKEYKSSSEFINMQLAALKRDFANVKVLEDLDKHTYYDLIGSSKLVMSTTTEENFGYCIVEAMALGTAVLAPDAFSLAEILEKDYNYLYSDSSDMIKKVMKLATTDNNYNHGVLKHMVDSYQHVVQEWARIIVNK